MKKLKYLVKLLEKNNKKLSRANIKEKKYKLYKKEIIKLKIKSLKEITNTINMLIINILTKNTIVMFTTNKQDNSNGEIIVKPNIGSILRNYSNIVVINDNTGIDKHVAYKDIVFIYKGN